MKYFTIAELCQSETATAKGIDNTPTEEIKQHLQTLIETVLDPLREWYGKPIYCNSGYRCKALNEAVGGVPTSFHTGGFAADIDVHNTAENKKLFDYIKGNLPFTEMGWEGNGAWVHVAYNGNDDKEIFRA